LTRKHTGEAKGTYVARKEKMRKGGGGDAFHVGPVDLPTRQTQGGNVEPYNLRKFKHPTNLEKKQQTG